MATDGIARFKDFSETADPIQFRVGTEVFTALPTIPLARMSQLSKLRMEGESNSLVEGITRVFNSILEPESYERFVLGLNSSENPIGITHVTQILPWLMEQYGLRPTEESSGSADSLTETGENSTDGLSAEDATSE